MKIIIAAAGVVSDYAAGVSLIHHEEAPVLLLKPDKIRDGRNVAIHAVNTLDDDENLVVLAFHLLQDALELGNVIMVKCLAVCLGKPDPFCQGIMGQGIIDNEIPPARKAADKCHVGRPATRADNGILRVLPFRYGLFKLQVERLFTREDTRA